MILVLSIQLHLATSFVLCGFCLLWKETEMNSFRQEDSSPVPSPAQRSSSWVLAPSWWSLPHGSSGGLSDSPFTGIINSLLMTFPPDGFWILISSLLYAPLLSKVTATSHRWFISGYFIFPGFQLFWKLCLQNFQLFWKFAELKSIVWFCFPGWTQTW